jgi:hypothetical protein
MLVSEQRGEPRLQRHADFSSCAVKLTERGITVFAHVIAGTPKAFGTVASYDTFNQGTTATASLQRRRSRGCERPAVSDATISRAGSDPAPTFRPRAMHGEHALGRGLLDDD